MSNRTTAFYAGKGSEFVFEENPVQPFCINMNKVLEEKSSNSSGEFVVISEVDGSTSEGDKVKSDQETPKKQKRKADSEACSPPHKRRRNNSSAVPSSSASVYVVISDADDDTGKPRCEEKSKEKFKDADNEVSKPKGEEKSEQVTVTVKSLKAEYVVQQVLGKGAFGQVVKCLDKKTNEVAALKITKKADYIEECIILQELMKLNTEKVPIVQVLDLFQCESKGYMVFELLDQSVLELIRKQAVPIEGIVRISKDLLSALVKLKQIGIIHTDIKPDNIMLVDHARNPYSVKLIDFGLSIKKNRGKFPKTVQASYYRSPEVLLELPYNEAIDMWSAGCVVGAVLARSNIYPGKCEYDVMSLIHETHGIPPPRMLKWNAKADMFFRRTRISGKSRNGAVRYKWRLKSPEEYYRSTGEETWKRGKKILNNLEEAVQKNFKDTIEGGVKTPKDSKMRRLCTDLLKKMLHMDPKRRITPEEALNHMLFKQFR